MKAIVLAAGAGKRLQSEQHMLPKVLRQANGLALIEHVLRAIDFIPTKDTVVVVGFMADTVKAALGDAYQYALQPQQLGTGHAVQCAARALGDYAGTVLVTCGDMPLLTKETYQALIDTHQKTSSICTVLSCENPNNFGYGRVLRNADGSCAGIVEQRDCTNEQAQITELNMGVYCFEFQPLLDALSHINNKNAQGEFYLTDAPGVLAGEGRRVSIHKIRDITQGIGVNTEKELAEVEEALEKR